MNLWWATLEDRYSFAPSIIAVGFLLASCVVTIVLLALERKKPDLYRVAVSPAALLLLLPTLRLGSNVFSAGNRSAGGREEWSFGQVRREACHGGIPCSAIRPHAVTRAACIVPATTSARLGGTLPNWGLRRLPPHCSASSI